MLSDSGCDGEGVAVDRLWGRLCRMGGGEQKGEGDSKGADGEGVVEGEDDKTC